MSELALAIGIACGVAVAGFLLFSLLIKYDSCPQCPSCDCEHTLYRRQNAIYEHWSCPACGREFVVDKGGLQ